MGRSVRCALVALTLVSAVFATAARAQTPPTPSPSPSPNIQTGDNNSRTTQSGTSKSGDAVGGQVAGINSNGNTSVNATNNTTDSEVTSGDANGTNTSNSFVGEAAVNVARQTNLPPIEVGTGAFADAAAVAAATNSNFQDGDNSQTVRQAADATSGDAVGGQVIGAVTAPGGTSTIVARNTTSDSDITSGDATSSNSSTSFTGLLSEASSSSLAAATALASAATSTFGPFSFAFAAATSSANALANSTSTATNFQEGSNRATINQSAPATTGDAVGGQVIGAVTAGASSIDASNATSDSSVTSGDATSVNSSNSFSGLRANANANALSTALASSTALSLAGPSGTALSLATSTASSTATARATASNRQTGDNRLTVSQAAPASTGDAVGGEVIGAVTSAGGASRIVAANNSTRVEVTSGDARALNSSAAFSGEQANATGTARSDATARNSAEATAGCVGTCTNSPQTALAAATGTARSTALGVGGAVNVGDGNDFLTVRQAAPASSGDAVGGQVIGAVTAGRSSIDARNSSVDTSVTSGDARSANASRAFSGLQSNGIGNATSTATLSNQAQAGALGFGDFDSATSLAASGGSADSSGAAGGFARNDQTGRNRATVSQSAPASSGDAVGGEVIGAVTSAGGLSSIVGRNTSDNVDVTSGDARSVNISNVFSGLNATGTANALASGEAIDSSSAVSLNEGFDSPSTSSATTNGAADANAGSRSTAANLQDGDNRATVGQSAPASSGDAVGGQVIGAVTSGSSVIDASNTSRDSSVVSGDANSANVSRLFAGLGADGDANAVSDALASGSAQTLIINAGAFSPAVATATALSGAADDSFALGGAANDQTGSNRAAVTQAAPASSGDAVGGEIIGAVTSAGGSTRIIGANTSDGVDVTSGDATSNNTSALTVGDSAASAVDATSAGNAAAQSASGIACLDCAFSPLTATSSAVAGTISGATSLGTGINDHLGDNRATLTQAAPASSGDAVGGQVIGAVSAGTTVINARNASIDSSVTSGDASSTNNSDAAVGDTALGGSDANATGNSLASATAVATSTGEFDPTSAQAGALALAFPSAQASGAGTNTQEGDNALRLTQTARATTGDGVAGEVIGAVTSAGGSADIAAANRSEGDDVTSGDASSTNDSTAAVGPSAVGNGVALALGTATAEASATRTGGPLITDTFSALAFALSAPGASATETAATTQTGDNRATVGQLAQATSGDAVAGQILGVVSAGAASVDATNNSTDDIVKSGDAASHNQAGTQTGPSTDASAVAQAIGTALATSTPETGPATDVTIPVASDVASPTNVQDGSNRGTIGQMAAAVSGDAVAGQIAGVVTAAGGRATGVLANTSNGIDSRSGDATFDNVSNAITGLFALTFRFATP